MYLLAIGTYITHTYIGTFIWSHVSFFGVGGENRTPNDNSELIYFMFLNTVYNDVIQKRL